jgi:thiamine biosynthesis protein ThiC
LYTKSSEFEIRKYLQKKYDTNQIMDISYEDLLKALRDQILSSTVVTICTSDKKDANKIFEILNAKGSQR